MPRSEPNFVVLPDMDAAAASIEKLRRQALRLIQGAAGAEDTLRLEGPKRDYFSGAPAAAASPAPARALMVGVVTMPAVFLVVVMVALALFGRPAPKTDEFVAGYEAHDRLLQPSAQPATGASYSAARSQSPQSAGIEIAEDARISGIALDGDRVALHVEGPMGQEILIYDYQKGRMIAAAPIETASLGADDSLSMLTGAPPAPSVKPRGAD